MPDLEVGESGQTVDLVQMAIGKTKKKYTKRITVLFCRARTFKGEKERTATITGGRGWKRRADKQEELRRINNEPQACHQLSPPIATAIRRSPSTSATDAIGGVRAPHLPTGLDRGLNRRSRGRASP